MHKNNWGTTLLGAIILLLLGGGLYVTHVVQEQARKDAEETRAREEAAQKAEFERELRAFTEGNPELKGLQELIDELDQEIKLRQKKLAQLAVDLRRASRAPESDADYVRWNRAIVELQKKLNLLQAERRETWIEWKKVENNPDRTPDLNKARDERVKKARGVAERTREQFNDLRNANRPEESISAPGPEKKEEKAPPKKRWWQF